MVTDGKSSSLTGFEIVFRLVMVGSLCQSVKTLVAKMAAPARAKITKDNQMNRVAQDLLSRY